jgi:hypothetical protein
MEHSEGQNESPSPDKRSPKKGPHAKTQRRKELFNYAYIIFPFVNPEALSEKMN